MNLEIKYSMHIDLVFHVLAYLKVKNGSNCYCQQYIDKMILEKKSFDYNIVSDIEELQEYYNKNFDRLKFINFLPFYSNNYNELKQLFLEFNAFTEEDKKCFLIPFIKVLNKESKFYFLYWQKKHNSCLKIRNEIEKKLENEFEKYNCLFVHFNKYPQLYLSYSAQNGRGSHSNIYFSAMAPFSNILKDFNNTFFTALHEYTHQFTDHLLNVNISMSDNSYATSEKVVILADYYIVKSIDQMAIRRYFKWISQRDEDFGGSITENQFFEIFRIENRLEIELKKTLNSISNISAL